LLANHQKLCPKWAPHAKTMAWSYAKVNAVSCALVCFGSDLSYVLFAKPILLAKLIWFCGFWPNHCCFASVIFRQNYTAKCHQIRPFCTPREHRTCTVNTCHVDKV